MPNVVLNPEHEHLYNLITKQQKKKCDKLECKANTGDGYCLINTCSLIDPVTAIKEYNLLKKKNKNVKEVF